MQKIEETEINLEKEKQYNNGGRGGKRDKRKDGIQKGVEGKEGKRNSIKSSNSILHKGKED